MNQLSQYYFILRIKAHSFAIDDLSKNLIFILSVSLNTSFINSFSFFDYFMKVKII